MAITVTHNDVEVVYDEKENVWRFNLRGRERSAESLQKAKEAIDKPVPEKAKKFEQVEAYKEEGLNKGKFNAVTITSIAEPGWRGDDQVWVTDGTRRSKVSASSLYPATPDNTETIGNIKAIAKQIQVLDSQIYKLKETLTCYKVEPETDEKEG